MFPTASLSCALFRNEGGVGGKGHSLVVQGPDWFCLTCTELSKISCEYQKMGRVFLKTGFLVSLEESGGLVIAGLSFLHGSKRV